MIAFNRLRLANFALQSFARRASTQGDKYRGDRKNVFVGEWK